jgi:hypothetical protein
VLYALERRHFGPAAGGYAASAREAGSTILVDRLDRLTPRPGDEGRRG